MTWNLPGLSITRLNCAYVSISLTSVPASPAVQRAVEQLHHRGNQRSHRRLLGRAEDRIRYVRHPVSAATRVAPLWIISRTWPASSPAACASAACNSTCACANGTPRWQLGRELVEQEEQLVPTSEDA